MTEQQHYTVRSLVVMAECTCNGHAVDCVPNNSTGHYSCVCGGNTTGVFCDQCLPFYNQYPPRYGVPCEGFVFYLLAHSKNPRKCAYHVTFDLDFDLKHTLDAGLPGDHRVQVWWRSSHLPARRSDFRASTKVPVSRDF